MLLTLQNCTELPRACTNLAQGLSLLAFLLSGYAIGVTNNPESGIIKWEHCELSSPCVLYVFCMYVCMYYYYCQEGLMARQGSGWDDLREGKCFNSF